MLLRAVSVTLAAFLTGSGAVAQGPPATASIEHLLQTYLLKPCIASAIRRSELKTQELAHFERIGEGDVPPMQSLPPLPYLKLLAYPAGGCAGVFHRPEEIEATAAAIGAVLGVEPGARQVSKEQPGCLERVCRIRRRWPDRAHSIRDGGGKLFLHDRPRLTPPNRRGLPACACLHRRRRPRLPRRDARRGLRACGARRDRRRSLRGRRQPCWAGALALHFPVVDPALPLHPEKELVEQDQAGDARKNPETDFQHPPSRGRERDMGSGSVAAKALRQKKASCGDYRYFTAMPVALAPFLDSRGEIGLVLHEDHRIRAKRRRPARSCSSISTRADFFGNSDVCRAVALTSPSLS